MSSGLVKLGYDDVDINLEAEMYRNIDKTTILCYLCLKQIFIGIKRDVEIFATVGKGCVLASSTFFGVIKEVHDEFSFRWLGKSITRIWKIDKYYFPTSIWEVILLETSENRISNYRNYRTLCTGKYYT